MAAEFCPQCRTSRTGAFRYCRSCGFDFETGQPATPVAPLVSPTARAPTQSFSERYGTLPPVEPVRAPAASSTGPGRPRVLAGIALLVLAAAGAAFALNQPKTPTAPAAGAAPTSAPTAAAPTFTYSPPEETSPAEVTTPPGGPMTAAVGELVSITCGDEPCMEITVQQVKTATKYGSGYLVDKPASGHVYLAVYIVYEALTGGATYNLFDWNLYVTDTLVEDTAYLYSGPEPQLGSGELANGRSAKGWIVWEVPKSGRAVLSYAPNYGEDPVFEVVVRNR